MEYRKLGRTGLNVSAIGLGTEHLEQSRKTMEDVLGTAVDAGVNYVDLLYGYDEADFWDNFGPVFRPYRGKFILAAHWNSQRCFEGVLARLGNNYTDIGMLQMVDTETKWNAEAQEALKHLQRYKEQGRIGYIGMSSHRAPIAIKAVNSRLIDVLMYPVNLTSHAIERDRALYQACVDQGVGLVAMKPYAGGTLFFADVVRQWAIPYGKPSGITPVQCLAYVLSLPVSTTVPGVKNVEELLATLHYLEATDEEKDYSSVIANIHHYLGGRNIYLGQCVYCNHCLPCPQNIDIAETVRLVNMGGGDETLAEYAAIEVKASECTECGVCMDICPFDVDVIAKMREAVEIFEVKAG